MVPTSCAFPIGGRCRKGNERKVHRQHAFPSFLSWGGLWPYHSVRSRSLCHMGLGHLERERERERPIIINIRYSLTFYLVILSQIENLELNDIVLPIL